MSPSETPNISNDLSHFRGCPAASQHEVAFSCHVGPETLQNRSIYDISLVNALCYGPSSQWLEAMNQGIIVPYSSTVDAHLQHRLSYPEFISQSQSGAPEVRQPLEDLLLRLESAVRSVEKRVRIRGMFPAEFLNCTTGITVDQSTECTPSKCPPPMHYQPWYPPPPTSTIDPSKTLKHFDLFVNLPIEMIAYVIEQCSSTDAVALSLTCKTLYIFARPLILKSDRDAFGLRDQNRWKRAFCTDPRALSEGVGGHSVCKKRSCHHCICVDCPLWKRLQSWVPKKLRFCNSHCGKFMLKRKFKNGRCHHSRPPRTPKPLLNFTYRRNRGGWTSGKNKAWKKYYSEADIKVAMDRHMVERYTESGYNLRKRPRPTTKRLEHVHQRMRGIEFKKLERYDH